MSITIRVDIEFREDVRDYNSLRERNNDAYAIQKTSTKRRKTELTNIYKVELR
jgi:hypothetical protein